MPDDRFRLSEEEQRKVHEKFADMLAKGYITPAKDPEPEPLRPSLRRPENPEEYIDANRFPATTLPNPNLLEQMAEDSAWMEELREYLGGAGTLTDRKRAELVELLCKVPVHVTMLKMIADANEVK